MRGNSSPLVPTADGGVAKQLVGDVIAVRNAPQSWYDPATKSYPWKGQAFTEEDYAAGEAQDASRASVNEALRKARAVQQIFAPPSTSAIEQTMQNHAMGYAPQFQEAYLRDMAGRTATRQQSARAMLDDMFGADALQQEVMTNLMQLDANRYQNATANRNNLLLELLKLAPYFDDAQGTQSRRLFNHVAGEYGLPIGTP
jgi:hypothetical protein